MTNRPETFESPVIRSSVTPSLKYSCAGSWLTLAKGSTATDGLSGNGRPAVSAGLGQRQPAQPAAPRSPRVTITALIAIATRDVRRDARARGALESRRTR